MFVQAIAKCEFSLTFRNAPIDRFARGDGGDTERAAGEVGLGLSISRRIVEQHQGRIWAENRQDGGARFCFALPTAA